MQLFVKTNFRVDVVLSQCKDVLRFRMNYSRTKMKDLPAEPSLQPSTNHQRSLTSIFTIPYQTFMYLIIACPVVSFTLCVLLSLWYNFADTTATHCQAFNILPSASAAVGNHTPQRYIWRFGIGLHIAPRMLAAYTYLSFLLKSSPYANQQFYRGLIQANFLVNILELLSLMGIGCISSTENYGMHRSMFVIFGVTSMFHMVVQVLFFRDITRFAAFQNLHKSFELKQRLLVLYIIALVLATYFFNRHNAYCENYMYSMFALAEYVVIFTNIAFHGTAAMDFGSYCLSVVPQQAITSNDYNYNMLSNLDDQDNSTA